jgi:hypothetical protein
MKLGLQIYATITQIENNHCIIHTVQWYHIFLLNYKLLSYNDGTKTHPGAFRSL